MHRPSRTRRILKWTGAGVSVLIFGAGVLSCWYRIMYIGGSFRPIQLYRGGVYAEILDDELEEHFALDPEVSVHYLRSSLDDIDWLPPLRIEREAFDRQYPDETVTSVAIELWLVLLLTAAPTAWLWHRDWRRIRPGCCLRCGYDLTGNTSGVCSECGEKTVMPTPPPSTT